MPCPVCGRINWVTNTDADSDTVALASICVNCWYLRTAVVDVGTLPESEVL